MTIPGLLVLMAILLATVRLLRARRRTEMRSRLLEVLARATRRGVPLVPLLERATRETRGAHRKLVGRLAELLGHGVSLSRGMRSVGRRLVPIHVTAAISAAEGTARLPDTLQRLAEGDRLSLRRRHQLGLVLLYPVLVLIFLTLTRQPLFRSRGPWSCELVTPDSALAQPGMSYPIAVAIVAGIVLAAILRRVGWSPGSRLVAAGRLLRTTATLLTAGAPLGESLRRAGAASGSLWMAWRSRIAARRLDDGDSAANAWSHAGLPAMARTRLAASEGRDLARTLVETAGACERRHDDRAARFRRLLYPTALLAAGVFVAVEFEALMRLIESAREGLW